MNSKYCEKDIKKIYKELETSIEGLSSGEAKNRLDKHGLNVLPKKRKKNILSIFFSEFKDPIVLLLIFSIIFSFLAGENVDAYAIIFIVLVDVLMGTYQENKANVTAESLSKMVKEKVLVMRDGKMEEIDSAYLTIGDIVLLESGDKILADMRIISSQNALVDESILTGESIQVAKEEGAISLKKATLSEMKNMLFAGTSLVKGRATAVVCQIGLDTELGNIAKSIDEAVEEKSPLTIRIEKFSRQITMLIVFIAIIVTIILLVKDVPHTEIFLSVIALSVSAMPEGLPLALTMALSIASNKMAKKSVITRKLHSVESLGSCTVIASDKTGTLTVNEQMAKRIVLPDYSSYEISGTGYSLEGEIIGKNLKAAKEIALLGMLNNEALFTDKGPTGDSIDIAFLVLGKKANVKTNKTKVLSMIPYESENKFSAVFFETNGEVYCTVKGSLEVVKKFSKISKKLDVDLDRQNEELASSGFRVISLASGKVKRKKNYSIEDIKNLSFKGMVGFIDPIREEAVESINECKKAGIKVLMITGDHPSTAFAIAKELKLTNNYKDVTTGEEVEKYLKSGEDAFDMFVSKKRIFSRVTPLQKLEIVESLKRQGEFVAVTGDGVNDAPALKRANIGIAMGSGTDIAKETANMIVLNDDFTSIVSGIKEGRIAYANIRKIILFLISCGLAEVLFFCLSIIADLPMPLVAVQLLWLNVVTDGLQDFALSFEKGEKTLMDEPPRSPKSPLFDGSLIGEIAVSGIVIGTIVFGVWWILLNEFKMDTSIARGYIMALMVFIQNIHVFNCRSEKSSAFSVSLFSNPLILVAIFGSIGLQILVMENSKLSLFLQTSSIPFMHLIYLVLIAGLIFVIMEFYKFLARKGKRN